MTNEAGLETGLAQILEGAVLAADKPLTVQNMADLFETHERPDTAAIREALAEIKESCEGRGFELQEVSSGFRFQVRQQVAPWVARLWVERPQKYSRALLETLALIAYRQPITRGEIEEIRGVAVSSNIIKTLHEREWIRVVGHRDVPGRPAMYATTRLFLDYFNLKTLEQLPVLAEIRDLDTLTRELGFEPLEAKPGEDAAADEDSTDEASTDEDSTDEDSTDEDGLGAEIVAETDAEAEVDADVTAEPSENVEAIAEPDDGNGADEDADLEQTVEEDGSTDNQAGDDHDDSNALLDEVRH